MKTITFYSYKGGVGRSLALSNIAKRLSEFGKKVCLIDFDLEAPGLHQKFKSNLFRDRATEGLVDYIHYFLDNGETPRTLKNYITKITVKDQQHIYLLPAGNVNNQEYWKKLSLINWNGLFYSKEGRGIELFLDLRERIKKEVTPDFLLIDSRTGITETSGITMSLLADEVVLLAANNDENIDGTRQIIRTLSVPENNFARNVPKINVVLSRIPYYSNPEERRKETSAKNRFRRKINSFLANNNVEYNVDKLFIIHSDPELELEEKLKIGYDHERGTNLVTPTSIDYLELFEELTKDSLSEQEKIKFNDIINAEVLLKQARGEEDNFTKIKLLKSALVLNPKSLEVFAHLCDTYIRIQDYQNALTLVDETEKNIPDNLDIQYSRGLVNYRMGKLAEAEKILLHILKKEEKHQGAIRSLGSLFYDKKDYEKSLFYYKKLIEHYPDSPESYNSVGNVLRVMKKFDEAFEFIYKALELNPKDPASTGTLAEIYGQLGNEQEFYKNLELSLSFGLPRGSFVKAIKEEELYKTYIDKERFLSILDKYDVIPE